MEDNIDTILLYKKKSFLAKDDHIPNLSWIVSGTVASAYGLWAMFVLPGFRKVPMKLKVPFLPSSKVQCENAMKLLKGRRGHLVDLGSGDGRLVLTAASMGFHCTGYELNPILLSYAKTQARWRGIAPGQATFVKKNFWTVDLSCYNNVTIFLAPCAAVLLPSPPLERGASRAATVAPAWTQHSAYGSSRREVVR